MSPLALALALAGPALPSPPATLDADGDGILDELEWAASVAEPDSDLSVLLGLRTPPTDALAKVVERAGGRVTARFERLVYLLIVDVRAKDLPAVLAAVAPELTWAQSDGPVHGSLLNATRIVRARDVWRGAVPGLEGLTGAGARVGVIDSGVDSDHIDLRDKVDRWLDVAGPRADGLNLYAQPYDRRGHGTAVASIAAGTGGGTLLHAYRVTMSRRFPPEEGAGWSQNFTIHVAEEPRSLWFAAVWAAGGQVGLTIRDPNGASAFNGTSGSSPWAWGSPLVTGLQGRRWSAFFFTRRQDDVDTHDTSYAASLEVPHEAIDEYPLMSGIARDAFVAACKALDDQARAGGVGFVIRCLEWMGEVADADGLAAVNLSLNFGGGPNGPLDTAVNELVTQHGVVVVVSAGNDQRSGREIASPGTAALALTIGATTTEGVVTLYSSLGAASAEPGKPDAVAPGGSLISGSPMFAADANDAFCKAQDWECGRQTDPYPDDHVGSIGTSLSAPIVAGAMALLAQARGGDLGDPLEAKALLLMTTIETGDKREINPDGDNGEVVGMSPGPKGFPEDPWDRVEGYGQISVEAFLEAATVQADEFPVGGEMSEDWAGRQVWARRIRVPAGVVHRFAVFGGPGVIYDLALYSASPDAVGRPILLGSGVTVAALAVDEVDLDGVLVVRRVSGEGPFTISRDVRESLRCAGHPLADEGAPQPDSFCTLGKGGCERTGRWSCDENGWAVCETQHGVPVDEVCGNDVDDDCDGKTDEDDADLGQDCGTGELGPCSAGIRECVAGALACIGQVEPQDETCDGRDEDCDGLVDETFNVGGLCSAGEGSCRREGTILCSETGEVAVCDAVPADPIAEKCGDDIDGDCDGAVDEGFEDLGKGCTVGLGACAITGAMVCGDFGDLICGVDPLPPGEEICGDGIDGDCDSATDEDCPSAGGDRGGGGCGCGITSRRSSAPGGWLKGWVRR